MSQHLRTKTVLKKIFRIITIFFHRICIKKINIFNKFIFVVIFILKSNYYFHLKKNRFLIFEKVKHKIYFEESILIFISEKIIKLKQINIRDTQQSKNNLTKT